MLIKYFPPFSRTHFLFRLNSSNLNKQTDMMPVCGMLDETINTNHFFTEYLSEECGVKTEDILDYDFLFWLIQIIAFHRNLS